MTATTAPASTRRRAALERRPASRAATALGVLGEVLITLGVLLGLFVVWQLWWTDVVAEREQAQVVEDLGWAADTDAPEPADPALEQYGTPPVLDEPEALTTFATLAVPRWGPDYLQPVSQGVGRDVIDRLGLGHYPGTAMPGATGNFAVAGHRVTYGKPLNRVEELELGDPLVVQTEEVWYVYRVTATQVVMPADVQVIAPVPNDPVAEPTVATMTLTTCHPMFSARERFIVHAELDHWMWVADGVPAVLDTGTTDGGA